MSLDWKKIAIIILFLADVALFGFLLYYFFFQPIFRPETILEPQKPTPTGQLPKTITINGRTFQVEYQETTPPADQAAEPETAAPAAGTTPVQTVGAASASFPALGQDGQIVYYDSKDGKFYRLTADNKISQLSDKVFNNVSRVTWSNNRDKAVLEYPDGSKIVYDFANKKQITLPKHWQDFSFSPNGQDLAFKSIALDPENRFLAVAKSDGSQTKVLERIGDVEDQFTVNWSPNNQMVAYFNKGLDLNRSEIYFIGLNNENFKLMTAEGRGFSGVWAPQGERMVYSVYSSASDYKPQLWVADTTANNIGDNRRSLGLETWGDKCAFVSAEKLYCAVPESLPFGISMDRRVANDIVDQIYEINLRTGVKRVVANPQGGHAISQIMSVPNASYLYFVDQNTGRIYKVNL